MVTKIEKKFKRLVIQLETPFAKTGNGAIVGGKVNNLMLIGAEGKDSKEGKKYFVKGLRGWINHAMMALAKEEGIEVCHSSEKTETQKGEKLLPVGLHPAGKCFEEGKECIKHKLMGSFVHPSKLKFLPVIIISKTFKGNLPKYVQQMHIATENRNALVYESKQAIQDFGERYFAGEFTLTIEFLQELSKEELGFLLKSILYAAELGLGASSSNGSGKVEVKQLALQEVIRSRTLDAMGKVVEEEKARNLWKDMQEGLEAW
ncbi:MAG: RAMP superfamily CRISPR-associated protein [Candidatus Thorarchaeota archaeon]